MISQPLLRLAGCGAVAGGLANLVADYLLRGGPQPVAASAITLETLGQVPFGSVFAGSLLGVAAIPLWTLGLWPVYAGLRPAGPWLARLTALFLGYGIAIAAGYHGAYALYSAGYHALAAAPAAAEPVLVELTQRFRTFHDTLFLLLAVPWTIGSVAFVVAVAFFRTHYPRWMAALSPLLVPLTMPLVAVLPAPIGGYVRPIHGTVLWTLFFLVSTAVVWNLGAKREAGQVRP
jgi:hypothetical protein